MKISEILSQGGQTFSFEFFPPKTDEGFDQLFQTIENLKSWNPGYVSVTYGAGGSTRTKTLDLVGRIKHQIGLEGMAHLTCVGHTADEIRVILDRLKNDGIDNVLALRGDPPQGEDNFVKTQNGFGYGNELVSFIRKNYDFCLGVAGYPEGHVECSDKKVDLENLKRKVDAGADFVVTQLFFENRYFLDFLECARAAGIQVPIIPGIMPVINAKQTQRFTQMCGASIPPELLKRLGEHQEDPVAIGQIGVEHATRQCEELLKSGVPGIHFYTLNRSKATLAILKNLKT
ncbi:MAG: methylenetetrahydrofolate reductase [Nitrospinaceae bacterium]|nr:MAG: methylenetetrahydrofolate reductase [Nitrospinaceae bacterium]